jgi:hypothetical protein
VYKISLLQTLNLDPLATPIYGGTSKNHIHIEKENIMPKVKLNPTFDEFRGSVNNLTYRKSYGRTFASVKVDRSHVQLSEAQLAHQQRFSEAVAYGKTVIADDDLHERYVQVAKERNMPFFALTIADFMHTPSITNIDLSAYNGQVNDLIKIKATDDFELVKVQVTISDAQDNSVLDNGEAVETAPASGLWLYTATASIPAGTTLTIKVVATDHPGGTAVDFQTKSI